MKSEYRRIRPETFAKFWKNLKLRLNYLRNVDGGRIKKIVNLNLAQEWKVNEYFDLQYYKIALLFVAADKQCLR